MSGNDSRKSMDDVLTSIRRIIGGEGSRDEQAAKDSADTVDEDEELVLQPATPNGEETGDEEELLELGALPDSDDDVRYTDTGAGAVGQADTTEKPPAAELEELGSDEREAAPIERRRSFGLSRLGLSLVRGGLSSEDQAPLPSPLEEADTGVADAEVSKAEPILPQPDDDPMSASLVEALSAVAEEPAASDASPADSTTAEARAVGEREIGQQPMAEEPVAEEQPEEGLPAEDVTAGEPAIGETEVADEAQVEDEGPVEAPVLDAPERGSDAESDEADADREEVGFTPEPEADAPATAISDGTPPDADQAPAVAAMAPAADMAEVEELVRRVVREELAGEMGQRLSRNLRKMISDEVAHALLRRH